MKRANGSPFRCNVKRPNQHNTEKGDHNGSTQYYIESGCKTTIFCKDCDETFRQLFESGLNTLLEAESAEAADKYSGDTRESRCFLWIRDVGDLQEKRISDSHAERHMQSAVNTYSQNSRQNIDR